MPLAKDSPLRDLPLALDPKQRYFLDGIRFSIETTDYTFDVLRRALVELTDDGAKGEESGQHLTRAVQSAWSLVDSYNRLRVLLKHLPNAKRKSPPWQLVLRALAPVEHLRNPIQHLNTEISRRVASDDTIAVWGAITWVVLDEDGLRARSCALHPAAVPPLDFRLYDPAEKVFHDLLDHIELTAYGHTVPLSDIRRKVRQFVSWFENEMRPQIAEHLPHGTDWFVMLETTFEEDGDGNQEKPIASSSVLTITPAAGTPAT